MTAGKEKISGARSATPAGCCRVESLLCVDERGQMVLPKEIRERAGIRPGDKLAVISWEKNGEVCCISLIKANELTGMVKDFLGPMMSDLGRDTAGEKG
ncbi:MAG TPA: HgcAB-associated protein [Spirochaetota bacterium]|nr:HgcAB-associated protein [Spirochaetota bacterium]